MRNLQSSIERLLSSRGAAVVKDILPDLTVAVGVLWLACQIFLTSWVSEDAYITFRVIDNFMQGYGLRWNIHERVQVYTHPLWMLIHIPVYALWNNLFLVDITLSIICSVAAIMIVLSTVRKPTIIAVLCFFAPLLFSKSFIDYTTSGLENPLGYMLFAWFGYILVRLQDSPRFWLWLSLSVALSMANRLDTVIFYAPALAWLVYSRFGHIRWKQVIIGALPLLAWLAFALVYYGFIFPNTKYAKLNTDMQFMRYLYHSVHYIKYFVVTDTLSAMLLMAPVAWLVIGWRKRKSWRNQAVWLPVCIAMGAFGYCLYVVYIGGDYMIGRFWALPVFTAVWLMYVCTPDSIRRDLLFCMGCAMLIGYIIPGQMIEIRNGCASCVVGKERMLDASFTFRGNRLVKNSYPLRIRTEGQYQFGNEGRKVAAERKTTAKIMYYIGMGGYYAGATRPLVDELALADPLLARLPASKRQNFYAGHFKRDIPRGYLYAIDTGSTERMDPSLAKYYEKLRLITSGDLFDPERLKTIILFNLGMYDHWKQEYVRRAKP